MSRLRLSTKFSINEQCGITSLNGKFYIVITDFATRSCDSFTRCNALCVFSADFTTCERLSVPVEGFALTHYHSQLILVGGVEPGTDKPTNQVWASDDGTNWHPSLPPMKVSCGNAPAAINIGCPDCVVVAGGYGIGNWTRTIEVLMNDEWFTACSIPSLRDIYFLSIYLHNETLMVLCGSTACCCNVESLISSCHSQEESCLVEWKKVKCHFARSSMLSFGHDLLAFGCCSVSVLCPATLEWLNIGWHTPMMVVSTTLPTGEIVILGEGSRGEFIIFKAFLNGM